MRVTLLSGLGPSELDRLMAVIWQVSKTTAEINLDPPNVNSDLIIRLLDENVPVLRHVQFTFIIEDMTISFREQLVRGVHDHYWIQSGRIMDYSTLPIERPKNIDDEDWDNYIYALSRIVDTALNDGQTPESFRDVIPLGLKHRGIWTVNLESLVQRFRKRSCWVAQGDKWIPVLLQVKHSLQGYHFSDHLARPPCMEAGHTRDAPWVFTGCKIRETMMDRVKGTDPLSVCPIYNMEYNAIPQPTKKDENYERFATLWGRRF